MRSLGALLANFVNNLVNDYIGNVLGNGKRLIRVLIETNHLRVEVSNRLEPTEETTVKARLTVGGPERHRRGDKQKNRVCQATVRNRVVEHFGTGLNSTAVYERFQKVRCLRPFSFVSLRAVDNCTEPNRVLQWILKG